MKSKKLLWLGLGCVIPLFLIIGILWALQQEKNKDTIIPVNDSILSDLSGNKNVSVSAAPVQILKNVLGNIQSITDTSITIQGAEYAFSENTKTVMRNPTPPNLGEKLEEQEVSRATLREGDLVNLLVNQNKQVEKIELILKKQ